MQAVQTRTCFLTPSTTARTRRRLGFHRRRRVLFAWLITFPKVGPLPHNSHFAIVIPTLYQNCPVNRTSKCNRPAFPNKVRFPQTGCFDAPPLSRFFRLRGCPTLGFEGWDSAKTCRQTSTRLPRFPSYLLCHRQRRNIKRLQKLHSRLRTLRRLLPQDSLQMPVLQEDRMHQNRRRRLISCRHLRFSLYQHRPASLPSCESRGLPWAPFILSRNFLMDSFRYGQVLPVGRVAQPSF